jgi:hypothetical protein
MNSDLARLVDRCVTVRVTVTDLTAVQRVLVLLTGRAISVTSLAAQQAEDGRWHVALGCPIGSQETVLLRRRLDRVPSVLAVLVDDV